MTTDKKTGPGKEKAKSEVEVVDDDRLVDEAIPADDAVDDAVDAGGSEGVDADEVVDSDSDESDPDLAPFLTRSTERRWPRRIRIGAALVVFVAALAASGFMGWKLWQQREVAQASQQARDAAAAYAQVLTSIDSNKVDENFNQVLDGATGEFKDMYSKSSMQLRQLLIDNKATAHGVVLESAVQSATKDKVVVLLFVDQSVSNTSVPDPRLDRSRIKMTMDYADGRWRTSKVELP